MSQALTSNYTQVKVERRSAERLAEAKRIARTQVLINVLMFVVGAALTAVWFNR